VPFWKWRAPGLTGRSSPRFSEQSTPQDGPAIADRVDHLVAEVARLGREQFRATTLLEGCGSSLDELGETVREHINQTRCEHAERAQALGALEDQVRVRLAMDLLPVADALQASILAARGLIGADRQACASRVSGGSHLGQRVLRFLGQARTGVSDAGHVAALQGWLEGQVLVERRLMALLDREGVRPIAAVGRTFDPHYHLAVAVSEGHAVADGTVVAEEVRGYTFGDRILRHAEVVIARASQERSRT
jgi:molecular chaperone GrpE (heat shock protein)